jgi:hypothetical protein
MNKKTVKKIESVCSGEIEFISVNDNIVTVKIPYCKNEFDIEIDGELENEQLESFVYGINKQLEDMIDHLSDCKLSLD